MFGLDEAAALSEPVDVDPLQKVVLEKNYRDQNEAYHEREAGEVMHILCRLSDFRESIRTDEGQEHGLAESNIESGEAENDKGHRRQPMRKTFKGFEAKNLFPRSSCRNSDFADDQIGQTQNNDHTDDDDCAAPVQQDFVEISPCPSRRLDQH